MVCWLDDTYRGACADPVRCAEQLPQQASAVSSAEVLPCSVHDCHAVVAATLTCRHREKWLLLVAPCMALLAFLAPLSCPVSSLHDCCTALAAV
jgi:hypothetical protein